MPCFYKQMERFISFLKIFFICSVKTVTTASIQKKHVKNSSLRRKMKTQSEKPEGIIKYSDAASFVSPNTVISLSLYASHAPSLTNEPALRSFDRRADRQNTYTPLSLCLDDTLGWRFLTKHLIKLVNKNLMAMINCDENSYSRYTKISILLKVLIKSPRSWCCNFKIQASSYTFLQDKST